MSGSGHACINKLRRYIIDDAKNKDNIEYDLSDFTEGDVLDVPQQHNGSDCGVFTCKFADFESRNRELSFDQSHMTYFRMRIAAEVCLIFICNYRVNLMFVTSL